MWTIFRKAALIPAAALLLSGCGDRKAAPSEASPALPPPGYPMAVTDITGHTTRLTHRPVLIVSLIPSITETVYALGAGDRLVAASNYCDHPEAARRLPKVGGYLDPDLEAITALKPDLVLTGRGSRTETLQVLRDAGIPTIRVESKNFAETLQDIRLIGRLLDLDLQAEQLAADMARRRDVVATRLASAPQRQRPKVLFLFNLDELGSVGPGSHIAELIELAGGDSITRNAPSSFSVISMERIVADAPEVLILPSSDMADNRSHNPTLELARRRFEEDKRWRLVPAAASGRVVTVDKNLLFRPGPRSAEALEILARELHPDLFPDKKTP